MNNSQSSSLSSNANGSGSVSLRSSSGGKGSRNLPVMRASCERCRSMKLACQRENGPNAPCRRCQRAGTECLSLASRKGRRPSPTPGINSQSLDLSVSASSHQPTVQPLKEHGEQALQQQRRQKQPHFKSTPSAPAQLETHPQMAAIEAQLFSLPLQSHLQRGEDEDEDDEEEEDMLEQGYISAGAQIGTVTPPKERPSLLYDTEPSPFLPNASQFRVSCARKFSELNVRLQLEAEKVCVALSQASSDMRQILSLRELMECAKDFVQFVDEFASCPISSHPSPTLTPTFTPVPPTLPMQLQRRPFSEHPFIYSIMLKLLSTFVNVYELLGIFIANCANRQPRGIYPLLMGSFFPLDEGEQPEYTARLTQLGLGVGSMLSNAIITLAKTHQLEEQSQSGTGDGDGGNAGAGTSATYFCARTILNDLKSCNERELEKLQIQINHIHGFLGSSPLADI